MFEDSHRLDRTELLLALALGGFGAVLASFVLFGMGLAWFALVVAGLGVLIGSMLVDSMARYWLAILIASIPLKMGKIFANPLAVRDYIAEYGFPPGALPVANVILTDLPFLVLMVMAGLAISREKEPLRGHPVGWTALLAVGWAGVSCFNAVLLDAALFELARLFQYLCFFWLAIFYVKTRADIRTVAYVAAASVSFQALWCVGQFFFNLNVLIFGSDATTASNTAYTGDAVQFAAEDGVLAGRQRGGGTVGHANVTAQYFEFWLPYVVAFAFTAREMRVRIIMWTAFLTTMVGLLFTFSRTGAVSIGFGLVCTVLALGAAGHVRRRLVWGLVAIGMLTAVAASPGLYYYMTTRPQMFEDRFWLARVALEMTEDNPMLGVGLNQSMVRFNEYDPDKRGAPERIHLYYLALMAERGVPGVIFFVAWYLAAMREAWRNARARDPAAGVIACAAFGALAAAAVHMTFDLFFGMPTQWSMWFTAGVAVAAGRMLPSRVADSFAEAAPPEAFAAKVPA